MARCWKEFCRHSSISWANGSTAFMIAVRYEASSFPQLGKTQAEAAQAVGRSSMLRLSMM
jgi:hypothetical protein